MPQMMAIAGINWRQMGMRKAPSSSRSLTPQMTATAMAPPSVLMTA